MMPTFFGAIADDLTGATDLAGLLARSGVPVALRMGVPDAPPTATAVVEVIALKCRTVPAVEAVAQARAALRWLQAAGAQRFFWKYCSTFDSTPDGNIGPVAEALMRDLHTDLTVHCPAFPENGRRVFMGHLFVGAQLLSDSPMKDHPLTPMRESDLLRLLRPQVVGTVGLADRPTVAQGPAALQVRLAQLRAEGVAHAVLDAVDDGDLQTIAAACQHLPLICGGSAVARPLPGLWAAQGHVPLSGEGAARDAGRGSAVVLSGSCSAMTNAQVAAFLAQGHPGYRLDPLVLADQGSAAALAWLAARKPDETPIIYATADPAAVRSAQNALGRDRAGHLVEDALAACAVAARDGGARRFVVAGGETSGAVAQALAISRLDVGAEIAPGVPWCFANSGGHAVAITLKSGNFGTGTFFADALAAQAS